MKITVLQQDIVWADPQANCSHIESLLPQVPSDTDLLLLPEMFSTGFATEPAGIAEYFERAEGGRCFSLEWMKRIAAERGFAVAGSVAVEESCSGSSQQSKFFNRFLFVKPDGSISSYNKHHLFTYGGEHKRFTRGQERIVVEWRGVRIMLQICYDLRFPTFSRNHGDYDMLLYVASWPTSRVDAWRTLLKARAIENQCYVAAANRVGADPACLYCGGSSIIDPYGKYLAQAEDNKELFISAEIDMEALASFREKFPVLNDAD